MVKDERRGVRHALTPPTRRRHQEEQRSWKNKQQCWEETSNDLNTVNRIKWNISGQHVCPLTGLCLCWRAETIATTSSSGLVLNCCWTPAGVFSWLKLNWNPRALPLRFPPWNSLSLEEVTFSRTACLTASPHSLRRRGEPRRRELKEEEKVIDGRYGWSIKNSSTRMWPKSSRRWNTQSGPPGGRLLKGWREALFSI